MKNKFCLGLALLVSIFFLSSCADDTSIMNYDSRKFIELYDYDSICVEYDYTQITDEDVKNIIEVELSTNEVYIKITDRISVESNDIVSILIDDNQEYYFVGCQEYSKEFDQELSKMKIGDSVNMHIDNFGFIQIKLTGIYRMATISDRDFILDYYNFSTFEQLEKFIKKRASQEIIFNYSYDKICENSSLLEFPKEIQNQIDLSIENYKEEILQNYSDFDEFLKKNEMTEDDVVNTISANFYDMMLYKAILDKEKMRITISEIDAYRDRTSIQGYNDYDIYKDLAYNKVKTILTSKTKIINND